MNEADSILARHCRPVKGRRQSLPTDRKGDRYGRWVVLRFDQECPVKLTRWICRCDCGTERSVRASMLSTGRSSSCGCVSSKATTERNFKHGKVHTRGYRSWSGMLARCHNPNNPMYHRYGGRGITVCPEWRESFQRFFADMGERPEGTSIERIDNNDGYHPGNCKWATDAEQSRNKRSSRKITHNGVTLTLTEWGRRISGSPWLVFSRLEAGWDEQRAVSTPVKRPQGNALSQAS